MDIEIKINTENAAFENEPDAEVARILRKLADWFENYPGEIAFKERVPLMDINGNTVGEATVFNGGES